MAENLILNSQKNEVLLTIQDIGLDPSEFQWATWSSNQTKYLMVSTVIHELTEYYFMFDFKDRKQFAEFSPGTEAQVEYDYPGSWTFQSVAVRKWLTSLKREIETPDLWAAIGEEKKLAEAASSFEIPNSPFTTE